MLCSITGSKCLLWLIYTWSKAEVHNETQSCKDLGYFCKGREGSKHMNSSYPQPLEVQLDQLLLFQKHDWAGVNSRLCSKKSAGENKPKWYQGKGQFWGYHMQYFRMVRVLWLGNSHYLCWEGQQFLLKLPGYFMTMQQKHACSMSLKNWRYANHLKVIWSHSLPNNFWILEVCCSFAGTAGVLYRQQGV